MSKQGDFPLCLTPRALGKQICCENQSSTGFRQKQLSAEARLWALSTSSRIHDVGGEEFVFHRGWPFLPCGLPKKRQKNHSDHAQWHLVLSIQNWAWVSAFPAPITRALLPQSCKSSLRAATEWANVESFRWRSYGTHYMRVTGYRVRCHRQELYRFIMLAAAAVGRPVLKHIKRRMLTGPQINSRFKW